MILWDISYIINNHLKNVPHYCNYFYLVLSIYHINKLYLNLITIPYTCLQFTIQTLSLQ